MSARVDSRSLHRHARAVPGWILALIASVGLLTGGECGPVGPRLAPPPGSYQAIVPVVVVGHLAAGERYVYTVDGSEPTAASWPICGPILLTDTTTVRVGVINPQHALVCQTQGVYQIAGILSTARPIAAPPAGTYATAQQVRLTSPTSGATIRFTTDGSEPTAGSPRYTGPITIATSTTLRARAFGGTVTVRIGRATARLPAVFPSGVMTASYTIQDGVEQVALPTIVPAGGSYRTALTATATTATVGAELRYRLDATDPGTSDPLLPAAGIAITRSATFSVRGFRAGATPSPVARADYVLQVPEPVLTPVSRLANAPFTVSVQVPGGAAVRYTLDGSDPTPSAPLVSGPILVDQSLQLRVQAEQDGWTSSAVVVGAYTLQAVTPTASLPTGAYVGAQSVALSTTTPDATIRYTLDGTAPTASSPVANGPIALPGSCTLTAIAEHAGWTASAPLSVSYILQTAAPTLTPPAGIYTVAPTIAATGTGEIRYSLDGSVPTATSPVLAAGFVLDRSATVTVRAFQPGWEPSAPVALTYTLQAQAPTASLAAGTYAAEQDVTLTSPTPGAAIIITRDGSDPGTSASAETVTGPVHVDQSTTLTARAVREGWTSSAMLVVVYTLQVPTPTLTPAPGIFHAPVAVTGAGTLRYTVDGTPPTATSPVMPANLVIDRTATVTVAGFRDGWLASAPVAAVYVMEAEAPTATPVPGTYQIAQDVTLSTPTTGAVVRFTTDGTDPTAASSAATAALPVAATTTITARAFRDGWTTSPAFVGQYRISAPPVVTAGPTATVHGARIVLAVTASGDGGANGLRYAWTVTGPSAVTWEGADAASAVAMVAAVGTYQFQVVITDAADCPVTATVTAVVEPVPTTVVVAPATATVRVVRDLACTVAVADQFAQPIADAQVAWTVSGGGHIRLDGVFTASEAGSWVVTATAGAASGTATVTVTPNQAPTILTQPVVADVPLRAITSTVAVVADDDGGADSLSYTWERVSGPEVAFDPANGSPRAAQLAFAPAQAGTLIMRCRVSDAEGASLLSSPVSVVVEAVPTQVRVEPAVIQAALGEAVVCTATAIDQFGQSVAGAAPATWSATIGSIDATGRWSSFSTGGGDITAQIGGLQGGIAALVSGGELQLAQAAWADDAVVRARTTRIHVRGADPDGESTLTYAWRVTDAVTGGYASARFFGAEQATYAARDMQVEFYGPGSYRFVATVTNAAGVQRTSAVVVQVEGVPQILRMRPIETIAVAGEPVPFQAAVIDQFDGEHQVAGTPQWSVTGGTIVTDGLNATITPSGAQPTLDVSCTLGAYSGTATIRLVSTQTPRLSVLLDKTDLIEGDLAGHLTATSTAIDPPASDLTDWSSVPALELVPWYPNTYLIDGGVEVQGRLFWQVWVGTDGIIHLGSDPFTSTDNLPSDAMILMPFGGATDAAERVDGGRDTNGNLAIRYVNAPLYADPSILVTWQVLFTPDGRILTRVALNTASGDPAGGWFGYAGTGLWSSSGVVSAFADPWQYTSWPSVFDIAYRNQPDDASVLTMRVMRSVVGTAVTIPVGVAFDPPPAQTAAFPTNLRMYMADGTELTPWIFNGQFELPVPFTADEYEVAVRVVAVEDWIASGDQQAIMRINAYQPRIFDVSEYPYLVGDPAVQSFVIHGVPRINPPGLPQTIWTNGGLRVLPPPGTVTVGEGEAPAAVALTLNVPPTEDLEIAYHYESDSAAVGADVSDLSGTVVVPAGTMAFTIPMGIVNDGDVESDEVCRLVLTSDLSAEPLRVLVTIIDDDAEPLVTMSGTGTVFEDGTLQTVSGWMGLSPRLGKALTLSLLLSGGTAEAGVDYRVEPFTVTIAAGVAPSLNDIAQHLPILRRVGRTASRTVDLRLVPGNGYTIDPDSVIQVTILDLDNGAPPSLAFAGSCYVGETASIDFAPALVDPDGDPVEISYALGAYNGLDWFNTMEVGAFHASAAGVFTFTPTQSGTFIFRVATNDVPPNAWARTGGLITITIAVHSEFPHTVIAHPDPFDATRFAGETAYRTTYLSGIIPGRVWLSADPSPDIPPLLAMVEPVQQVAQNQTLIIRLSGAPNAPVSLTCLGSGSFPVNQRNAITVLSDAAGVATVEFRTKNPGDVPILAASPMASGRIRFLLEVQP
jgi:hypothetical protein